MAKVLHTCTECVPIDAAIIDAYVALVDTQKRALAAAEEAEAAAGHTPYIGENGNWWEWDNESEQFVDTGVPASGGGGSDPNAVRYTPQTLTEVQKAQARANINADSSTSALPGVGEIDLLPTVNYTAQSLTSEQQAQARQNIGAGTSSFTGDYRDLSNKPEIPEATAISTNIKSDKNTNAKAAGAKAVYDEVHPPVETVRYSWGMSPNVFYNLGELSGNIIFLFATPEDNTIVNHYYFTFDTGNTPPTVTWPVEITDWFGMAAPTIVANHHYEVSVINGVAAYLEV